ncbi:MAG TPA: serine hydrolase [Opitutaceae bacterium]|nr:serine hydrolase [Opitutaceae bacterium]
MISRKFVTFLVVAGIALTPTARAASSLPRGVPEEQGIDSTGILKLIDALEHDVKSAHSLMIVRHGKVVAEGWWSPYAAEDTHVLYSLTKSFTSTAVGFAVKEGKLSLDDRVISFFPDLAPANPSANLRAMRVRDLLRMNSGHQNDTMDRLRAHADGAWVKAFLSLEVENKPGTRFVYNSGASYVLSAIVQKVTGQTLNDYLQPRLFTPLGIDQHPWAITSEGIALGEGGLALRTEDIAKFGLMYLQRGLWNGEQLLPVSWVAMATSLQTSNGSDPNSNWEHGYGFQFWINKTTGFRGDGAMGQLCFVLPEYDTVVAVTSGTSDMGGLMDTIWEALLPAIHVVPLTPNFDAQEKLRNRLSHLTLPTTPGEAHSAREKEISGKTYTFPANDESVSAVRLDFSGEKPVITFQNEDGQHAITCGVGAWTRGRTGFQKSISRLFDRKEQGVGTSGAWTAPNIFTVQLCFDETPYIVTYRFTIEGDKLLMDTEHNVRWGPTTLPQLTGSRAP